MSSSVSTNFVLPVGFAQKQREAIVCDISRHVRPQQPKVVSGGLDRMPRARRGKSLGDSERWHDDDDEDERNAHQREPGDKIEPLLFLFSGCTTNWHDKIKKSHHFSKLAPFLKAKLSKVNQKEKSHSFFDVLVVLKK